MSSTSYLLKEDYLSMIRRDRLDQILEEVDEDEDVILNGAENEALGVISYYLGNYYDMDYEFNLTGNARSSVVLRWAKVLVIFFIYDRVPDDMVPERVIKNYDDVLEQLDRIDGAGKGVPGLKPITVPGENGESEPKTRRRWGSLPARSNDGGSPRNRY